MLKGKIDTKKRLIEIIDNRWGYFDSGKLADDLIANGVEIVGRGTWSISFPGYIPREYTCSQCGHSAMSQTNYCPECGSKMKRSQDKEQLNGR